MRWDTRLSYACDWFLRKDGAFVVELHCYLHRFPLPCYHNDDELTLTSGDRESLLQSWQKEKKGVQRSFNMFIKMTFQHHYRKKDAALEQHNNLGHMLAHHHHACIA